MLPAELFLQENAAPQHRGHAVGGDDGRGQGHVFRVRQRVDVGELARRLADSAHVLGALPLGDESAVFDENRNVIDTVQKVSVQDKLTLSLSDGTLDVTVEAVRKASD